MKTFVYLSPHDLILTNKGIVRAQDINPADLVYDADGDLRDVEAIDIFVPETAYKITFKDGTNMTVYGNEIETSRGTKELKDLNVGDFCVGKFTDIKIKSNNKIDWEDELGPNATPIKIPQEGSPCFFEWLGYATVYAKINKKNGRVSFEIKEEKKRERLLYLTKKVFDLTLDDVVEDGRKFLRIHSFNLMNFLAVSRGSVSKYRKVHRMVMESDNFSQLSFLKGVFSKSYMDGRNLLLYSGKSKFIIDYLTYILYLNGVLVRIKKRLGSSGGRVYYLYFRGTENELVKTFIPFILDKGMGKFPVPINMEELERKAKLSKHKIKIHKLKNNYKPIMFNKMNREIGIENDFFLKEICDIKLKNNFKMLRISLDGYKRFLSNGLILM